MTQYLHKIFRNKNIFFLLCAAAIVLESHALPKEHYTESSVLSSGNWAKVEVSEAGMQFISNTILKNLGFSDPSKVNVYGYGGRMLSESLTTDTPDDLPLIPSIVTSRGIVFFGHATTRWQPKTRGTATAYSHTGNAYSDKAYYFISDREAVRPDASGNLAYPHNPQEVITVFTERLVHEQDLIAPSNTGRLMLGEDFRVQRTRQFSFDLTGNTGDAVATVAFGAKTSAGVSSLLFTANDSRLEASYTDQISATSSSKFITTTITNKQITKPGEKLNLSIEFQNSGAVSTAALDYIEIEYPRELRLYNNELYFYLNPLNESTVNIGGCSDATIVWNVTDPENPVKIEYTISNGTISFGVNAGYAEFVAFNPENVQRSVSPAGKVRNQDLHALSVPGMLVISPDAYKSAANRFAQLHASYDGLDVLVLTPEEIYNEFSCGNPDVTAFRRLLKMWYDRVDGNEDEYTRYCMIMSRPTYDNKIVTAPVKKAGYPRVPIWQSPTGDTESNSYSTDDYIGMLADNPYGLTLGNSQIHVAVGRMPVKSLAEANTAITKLENYLTNSKMGSWRNNVMIIADDQDNGVHMQQAENCVKAMRSNGNGDSFLYEKLYLDSYPLEYTATGASYPAARARMFEKLSEGVSYLNYIGHANPAAWGHEGLLTWTDITNFNNTNLPFIYAATCEFLRWDADDVSGAEELWLNPSAGVIGMICPSRSVLISANGVLNKSTSAFVFQKDKDGKSLRVGDIMIKGKNASNADTNKLRYGLIGDPAMRLPSPELDVKVLTIDGIDVTSDSEMPELSALSTAEITGVITDNTGSVMENFDGIIEIQLYDAEKVVTTYGNGMDGVPYTYNDRKTRLYHGRVNVKRGEWKATMTLPSEIENNYSPALLSFYASSNDGMEANGTCENFYVYGFNENAPEDLEGPEIRTIYLNHPAFSQGDLVSPSPTLTASIYDFSGINVSDAGIGHSMFISIDGKEFFNDVALYYTPDLSDPSGGIIEYPLSNITPGEHSLTLTVWDNANNSSSATLDFNVSASWLPEINILTTDVNPASTSVNFIIGTDGNDGAMQCSIEVFDLAGRKVWTSSEKAYSGSQATLGWDLCDSSGARVQRGIYIYRGVVTTAAGATIMKSKKLAVTAR